MKDNCILTAESVTEGHPDKLCDTIADAVVDACLTQDAAARVACEVMATAGKIIAAGEITAAKIPDIPAIICRTVREAGYGGSDYEVEVITHEQSPDIAEAVCGGTETGAGDQGILYGFACDETKELLPLPVVLAHRLTRLLTDTRRQGIIPGLRPDGKAQVSVEYRSGVPYRVAAVVVSCQHEDELPLPELRRDILRHVIRPAMQELPLDEHTEVLVNPSGRFVQGGFDGGYLRRPRPSWRRRAVRQGWNKGGPQRRVHGPLYCQEYRGGGTGKALHHQPCLCHRQGTACSGDGGYGAYRHLFR